MTKPQGGLTLRGEFVLAIGLVTLGWLSIRALAYLLQFISNLGA
jgi:hypothetical protein